MRRAFAVMVAGLVGCASYRYEVVRPEPFAGPADGRAIAIDPLRYAVAVADDRLSIRIDNPTGDTVRLIGADSSVVDPAGRSHPLIGQTIAPASHVVVVLPPLRPWFGATADVGAPTAVPLPGGPTPAEQAYDGDAPVDPGYDRSSPVYWDWPGPGDVRLHLVYRRADGTPFAQDLAFRRSRQ